MHRIVHAHLTLVPQIRKTGQERRLQETWLSCVYMYVIDHNTRVDTRRLVLKKNCFTAWASTLNMGLINKVNMVCLLPVGYGV